MAYETVADIINDAAQLVAIPAAANPVTSTDANMVHMMALLKSAGRALIREHLWPQLQSEHTFSTTAGDDTYPMPADFDRHIDQTQWNRDAQLQLAGPLNAQGWQSLKTLNSASSVQFFFRTSGANLVLFPEPTDAQNLALEYMSSYWVQATASANRDKDKPTVASDILWFDSRLLVQRLRRDWLQAKGLDSTQASNEYDTALAAAKGSSAAPVLNLSGAPRSVRMLGYGNLPTTGWAT